jgi:hypothetical protein
MKERWPHGSALVEATSTNAKLVSFSESTDLKISQDEPGDIRKTERLTCVRSFLMDLTAEYYALLLVQR